MNASNSPIALVEAAYDLEISSTEWLPKLLRAGGAILNLGQGCAGAVLAGTSEQGEPLVSQLHTENAPEDLATRLVRAAGEVESSFAEATPPTREPVVRTLAETRRTHPEVHAALTSHIGCKDMLALWAVDSDVHGVGIHMPSSALIELDRSTRRRWQMLSTHIAAGHRLRRGLGHTDRGVRLTEIPIESRAVLDPKDYSVVEASGEAKEDGALAVIRSAAIGVDVARSRRRKCDADEALRLWQGVARGRWSIVDSFDNDGRRFIVAFPNEPCTRDPRGLTEREYQVATQAATGDSCKLIAYNLGISRSRVSALLSTAMRKLGVQSRAQLIIMIRAFLAESASRL